MLTSRAARESSEPSLPPTSSHHQPSTHPAMLALTAGVARGARRAHRRRGQRQQPHLHVGHGGSGDLLAAFARLLQRSRYIHGPSEEHRMPGRGTAPFGRHRCVFLSPVRPSTTGCARHSLHAPRASRSKPRRHTHGCSRAAFAVSGPAGPIQVAGEPVTAVWPIFPNLIPQLLCVSYDGQLYMTLALDEALATEVRRRLARASLSRLCSRLPPSRLV